MREKLKRLLSVGLVVAMTIGMFAAPAAAAPAEADSGTQPVMDVWVQNSADRAFASSQMPETAQQFCFADYDYIVDAIDTVTGKIALVMNADIAGTPIISSMGAGNKMDPTAFEVADIYSTSVCPLAKVMRRELKRRGIKKLKVVYSKEEPITPIEDMAISCRAHCICPPGTARKCTQRRQIPGSNAFVPPVVGLIIAGEVIKDLTGYGSKRK